MSSWIGAISFRSNKGIANAVEMEAIFTTATQNS